jgi:arabinogalactan oligomer/maltooligosaccharide transport system permease protein
MNVLAVALLATRVVVWHTYRADEQVALERAAQAYSAQHPDVLIEPVAMPFDGFTAKLEAAIPHGNGPDLFVASHEHLGEWSRAGLVKPLDGLVDPHAIDAYLDGTVEPLRVGGHLYGLPLAFKSLALFYRTDRVAEPPADTDALYALAKAMRQNGRYALAYESGSMFYHAALLHGFGGRILDEDGRPQLDSDASVAALAWLRKLTDDQLLPEESTNTVASQLFNDGQAAMTINGPWFVGEIAGGVPWKVAPLPTVSATRTRMRPLLTVEALLLAERAHAPAEALAFARWLTGPEGGRLRAVAGRQTVAARAAWDAPEVKNDPVLRAFREQLPDTMPMSNRPEMNAVWEPAQRALRRVLRGAADPRTALKEAQLQILEALRPAPPRAPTTPYAIGFGALGLLGAVWAFRRGRRRGGLAEVRRQGWAYAYLAPAMIGMAVLVFVPFTVGAVMSLYHHESGRWTFIGLSNFRDILASKQQPLFAPLSFYFTLVVTALWTVANVALHVLVGVSLALLLRDPMLKLRGVYRMLLIVPWAVPNYITALIWKGMFHRQFGAVNGLLAFVGIAPVSWFSRFWTAFTANLTTNVWLGFPFMMVVTLGALGRIPRELEEAAALDGASRWQRLRHVTLPLLWPAMLPSVLLGAIWTFNMFNIVFLVSGGEPDGATEILVTQAYRWAFTRGHVYGYAATYAVLILIVLAVQTALARRFEDRETA